MTTMTTSLSPVSLSYMAALRGFKPRQPGDAFIYALVNCTKPELLIGLAASNPEGKFFGVMSDSEVVAKASQNAVERQVGNVTFMHKKIMDLLQDSGMPSLDYLVCDETSEELTHVERAALFDLAQKNLKANGLFNYNYRAYDKPEDVLRFLVREYAPEMDASQASDFLLEIKKLGELYLKSNSVIAQKLDQAIAKNMPDEFFALFDAGESRSVTFDTVVAMRTRGMVYAGAGQVERNYVELSIPAEAQNIIIQCRPNPLCESIKDFAILGEMRADIWSKSDAVMSSDPAELFGSFAYGITMPEDKVPMSVDVYGKVVDLSEELYRKLIAMMVIQPIGIGDFLQHSGSDGTEAAKVVMAMQILVALGIAKPMRGARESGNVSSLAQPRFSGSFNRFIDTIEVSGDAMTMASRVMGDVMKVGPRDVMVMQALNRAGLANSVAALLPELERLAKDPAASSRISEVTEPTPEFAHQMINDSVSQSIVQWYAYGLLEAA